MGRLVLLLALVGAFSLNAAPAITEVHPNVGPSFWWSRVSMLGSEFSTGFVPCQDANAPAQCPVEVLFGTQKATVTFVTPTTISVEVAPQPPGPVDVVVRIEGQPEIRLANGFRFFTPAEGNPDDYVKYLVPVTPREIPGANGSVWKAELSIHSSSRQLVHGPVCPPALPVICPGVILPDGPIHSLTVYPRQDVVDGAFLYVPKDFPPALHLRVRDLSLNSQSRGTEIRIPKSDEFSQAVELLEIPTDPRYRSALRIYTQGPIGQEVRVSVFKVDGGEPIETYDVNVAGIELPTGGEPNFFPAHPAYVQLDPLSAAARASGDRVRVRVGVDHLIVSPPPPDIWAFISITNNETQQVTTVTPQR